MWLFGPPLVVRPVEPPTTPILVTVPPASLCSGEDTQTDPLDFNTFPEVPTAVSPVPP